MKILNRDGILVEYDRSRIYNALKGAFEASRLSVDNSVYDNLIDSLDLEDGISVEEIQDDIIRTLRETNYNEIADEYLAYRKLHEQRRKDIQQDIDYMIHYATSKENAATSSNTDANANMTLKNVSTLETEVPKTRNREIQRGWMKWRLKKEFPELAKQYEKDLKHHILYAHDEASSSTLKNYCEAVTLYPLAVYGTSTMDGTGTKAPKHLSTFAGQICNLLFLLSAQCKGAVAFGEFFNFFDHYAAMDLGPDYDLHCNDYYQAEYIPNRKTIKEVVEQYFQQIVYYWNQPAGNRGSQSPFSNISYYDENYWHALFDDFVFPDGTKPLWRRVNWLQKTFMKWFNKERSKVLLTFPVETMALLTDNKDVIDKDYKDFTAEMWAKGHSFFVYLSNNPDSLASCCRLRNQITENVFSFTNGLTGVQTGSCNVFTLNLNRIIQDWFKTIPNYEDHIIKGEGRVGWPVEWWRGYADSLKAYLTAIVERVQKYHIAFKENLYMFEKAGMLTASSAGYISMKKLYSTIGLNGINEAAMFLGMDISYNDEYRDFCRFITGTISELNKKNSKKDFLFNQEFVPAESLGSKNFNWDKADEYWIPDDGRVLYNSYFYDAHDNTSVIDKLKMHGKDFTETLDGGVGCHINLDEHLSKKQYLHLLDLAIKFGTSYFTFNVPNCQCDKCGHIEKHHFDKCPICGSEEVTDWTRVIGFLRPTKKFDHYRQIEATQRMYSGKDGGHKYSIEGKTIQ